MLGHLVATYLRQAGCEVVTSAERYAGTPREPLLQAVHDSRCAWVINALGAIPQKVEDAGMLFRANTQFPLHLLQELGSDQRLIHASTDCVFSGMRGQYRTDDPKDADTEYGRSKALGEAIALDPRVVCLRTSLVGPELGAGSGLLGWFLKQKGEVDGYTNHFWNGITTLEWAKAALELIRGTASIYSGVVQLGLAESVSKFELLNLFAEVWATGTEVQATTTTTGIDRTLMPDVVRPPLREQLLELRQWMQASHDDNQPKN